MSDVQEVALTEAESVAQQPTEEQQQPVAPESEASAEDTLLTDADREKLTGVVGKERAAAKAATKRAEQAESRLVEMQAREMRRTVAEEKGLNTEQAVFLTGATAEEMAASADALLAAFPPRPNTLQRLPRESLRSGATGARFPAESMSAVAEKVLD